MVLRRLVLVEDEPELRSLIHRVLTGIPNLEILAFDRAEDALPALAGGKAQLLIADLRLPGMSGVELIALARDANPALPVIVATGYRSSFQSSLNQLPSVDVLEKPYPIQDLRDRTNNALRTTSTRPFHPFSLVDYLQMASLGRQDLAFEVRLGLAETARISIVAGEVWSCELNGEDDVTVLERLLMESDYRVTFDKFDSPPERTIHESIESVLLRVAGQVDRRRAQ